MFWMLCKPGATRAPSPAETGLIDQLVTAHSQLVMDGELPNVQDEAGYGACVRFLSAMEGVARGLGIQAAPRTYRSNFSLNYRALFPDEGRNYRVDIFEASSERESNIWVNSEKFELSPTALQKAEKLQRCWAAVNTLLARWVSAYEARREEFVETLGSFDAAWAGFEESYIAELIHIEEHARRLIVQAVDQERRLTMLEKDAQTDTETLLEAKTCLVAYLSRINSVANYKRKGRDDLGVEILECANAALHEQRRCGQNRGAPSGHIGAAAMLANDVIASFNAIRQYLCDVSKCLPRVDPHLCNNVGLVARLVDWEESWEVANRYMRDPKVFRGLCDIVSELWSAQSLAPALTAMCNECAVELFMVLPRLVVLFFISQPGSPWSALVRSLIPHRFTDTPLELRATPTLDAELSSLVELYKSTENGLVASCSAGAKTVDRSAAAWNILVTRAVSGNGDSNVKVEGLMRELERWSLELQRHCPEDWNQCSAVIVQCLTGGSQKNLQARFQV